MSLLSKLYCINSLESFKWYDIDCNVKAHFICQKRSCLEFPKQTISVSAAPCKPSCDNGLAAEKCLKNNNTESCIACNIGYNLDKKDIVRKEIYVLARRRFIILPPRLCGALIHIKNKHNKAQ